ncbi:sugar ABC transporter substrate-binding protein [Paenibacillus sp.]|uniref:ABC transporter substrate-binding protein n=1 Tax=Paenibacillus sp. TaxID=58172 RepID=UPI0028121F78|nr:sugar ABC transporter substrate-binding protein [Paenibacillus sp.]
MNQRYRFRGVTAAMAVFAIGLAACGGNGGSGTDGEKVELSWWVADPNQVDVMKQAAEAFTAKHPNITVDVQTQEGDYYAKLQTTFTAGNGPDLTWIDGPSFQKFQSKGFLLDVTELAERDGFSFDPFVQPIVELYKAGDKHYGIPKDMDSIGLFYNKAMFDAAGLEYPTGDWTWDDLRDAAKKLTIVEGGETKQWGIALPDNAYTVHFPFMVQNGATIMNEDKKSVNLGSPEAVEAIEFIQSMIHDDKVSPDGKYLLENDPAQLFQSGKVAMIYDGSWMVRGYYDALKENVDVSPLPQGKRKAFTIHGVGWVANAKTKHPDEVWELMKFLGSEQFGNMQAETGLVIPAYAAAQAKWTEAAPMRLKEYAEFTQYGIPYPTSFSTEWEQPMYNHFADIWIGEESVAEGLAAMEEEANEILATLGQ